MTEWGQDVQSILVRMYGASLTAAWIYLMAIVNWVKKKTKAAGMI